MTSHVQPYLHNRPPPRRKPNQHHLPPLLPPPSMPSKECMSSLGSRAVPLRNCPYSPVVSRQGSASQKNCCSVSTVGVVAEEKLRCMGADSSEKDVINYAVEHQLPKLLNDMIEALLCERPEENVDAWIFRWFERTYERRRAEAQKRPAQPAAVNSPRQRAVCGEINRGGCEAVSLQSLSSSTNASQQSSAALVSARQRSALGSPQCPFVLYSPRPVGGTVLPVLSVRSDRGETNVLCGTIPPTIIAQRSLPPAQDTRQLPAGDKEHTVLRSPRGVDFRLKSSPHTVDSNSNNNNNNNNDNNNNNSNTEGLPPTPT